MTHRDRAGDPLGRREAAGDAGHRQGFPTPPAVRLRDRRRRPKALGGRGPRLAVGGNPTPSGPSRKPWDAVSMGQ